MPGFKLALLTWPQGHSQKNDSKTIISKVQVQVNNKCEVDTEALQKRVLRLMASLFSKKFMRYLKLRGLELWSQNSKNL